MLFFLHLGENGLRALGSSYPEYRQEFLNYIFGQELRHLLPDRCKPRRYLGFEVYHSFSSTTYLVNNYSNLRPDRCKPRRYLGFEVYQYTLCISFSYKYFVDQYIGIPLLYQLCISVLLCIESVQNEVP